MKINNKFTNSYFITSCTVGVFVLVKKLLIIWLNKKIQCNTESKQYYIISIPISDRLTIYQKARGVNLFWSAR